MNSICGFSHLGKPTENRTCAAWLLGQRNDFPPRLMSTKNLYRGLWNAEVTRQQI